MALCVVAAAGCGGGEPDGLTIYLRARLGPDGPPGQRAAVLAPVERARRPELSLARQAVLEILVGPSPGERTRGFLDSAHPETRLLRVDVAGGTATVELAGREPSLPTAAAIVYSLAGLDGVERVQLHLDGRPCCVRTHAGAAVPLLTPADFRGWQAEPCAFRREHRCRG